MPFSNPKNSEMLIYVNIPSERSLSGNTSSNIAFGWDINTLHMRDLGSKIHKVYVGETETTDLSALFDVAIILDPNHFSCNESGYSIYSSKTAPKAITALENIRIFNRFGEFTEEEQARMFMVCYNLFLLLNKGTIIPENINLKHLEISVHPNDQADFRQVTNWAPIIDPAKEPIAYPNMGEYKKLEKYELRIVMKPFKQHPVKKIRINRHTYKWAWNSETAQMRALSGESERLMLSASIKEWQFPVFEACRRLDHNFTIAAKNAQGVNAKHGNIDNLIATLEDIKQYYLVGELLEDERRKVCDLAANAALCLLHGDGKSRSPKPLKNNHIKTDLSMLPHHIQHRLT